MLHLIFTLDYEIYGSGEGDPYALMVEPTRRLLDQMERWGAKLTIMPDVAEILRFKEHWETTGRDDFHYQDIARQLQDAIRRGHDVQLHLHPSYFKARLEGTKWLQEMTEYECATLPPERITWMIQAGKEYLENLLRPIKSDYQCIAFRAGNWAAQPSPNLVHALLENGFLIESSVFKGGRREGPAYFDYSQAPHGMLPWPVDKRDVCKHDPLGRLWEFPIYCEPRWIGAFMTPGRFHRGFVGWFHSVTKNFDPSASQRPMARKNGKGRDKSRMWTWNRMVKFPWKADFNQCTGGQLVGVLKRVSANDQHASQDLPFILIGHSRLCGGFTEGTVERLLKFAGGNPSEFGFNTLGGMSRWCGKSGSHSNGSQPAVKTDSYVLVTPARNEEASIEHTIQSVIGQTLQPREWVIVSDGSTDRTDEIVQNYSRRHPFISLVRRDPEGGRCFSSTVHATEWGCRALKTRDYDYLGLLDADLRFQPDYFADLIARFKIDPRLGLAGGVALDVIDGKVEPFQWQNETDVSGAVQFFRRPCFESLGGLAPLPQGGWDVITCAQARANGFLTRTFFELVVEHLKPRNMSEGGLVKRAWHMGVRDYALGYPLLFESLKSVSRMLEKPFFFGGMARFSAYLTCLLAGQKRMVPPPILASMRAEWNARLKFWK